MEVGLSGHFRIDAVRPDGTKRQLADWQDNLLTDAGLYGLSGINHTSAQYCHVGTGNVAPNILDTTLQIWKARNTSKIGDGYYTGSPYGASSTPPYYGYKRGTYRFAAGVATGNLSELGLSDTTNGTNLFTRALIKDTLGNPTSITVLADEMLDITYEIRMYPPLDDKIYTINISGIDYTFTIRAANVTDGSVWGYMVDHTAAGSEGNGKYAPGAGAVQAYKNTTALGGVTSSPNGSTLNSASAVSVSNLPAEAGVLFRDFVINFGVNAYPDSGKAITALMVTTTKGRYQMMVSPPLPKDGTNQMQLTFRLSWARYIP